MHGHLGIGCISDYEPQPLLVNSHLGSWAITTVGIVTNKDELVKEVLDSATHTFWKCQAAKSTRQSLS